MSLVIDRRPNGRNKSADNRQRFLRRCQAKVKKAVEEAIAKRGIRDIEQGEKIKIPSKDIHEPCIRHGEGGNRNIVLPGNKDFVAGDQLKRPDSGQGQGGNGEASDHGEGEDEFVFEISREEFLEFFFEDLALPDLVKTQITRIPHYQVIRAGIVQDGTPTNLNIVRSMRAAAGRRTALRAPYKKKIKRLEKELNELLQHPPVNESIKLELEKKISRLYKRRQSIPFLDDIDLRYNNRIKKVAPTTQAVMFCLMDVSGSMDEMKKDISKRFFILLYLFLNKNYEHIDLIFIRHHTSAKEVDEQEFFYSRETGGTVVSSALELMSSIIKSRYNKEEWNIYAAQASDGDNWNADSPRCKKILSEEILPHLQYFAYVEIMPRYHQSLWEVYSAIKSEHRNFDMKQIDDRSDIYPVFHELFKRPEYA